MLKLLLIAALCTSSDAITAPKSKLSPTTKTQAVHRGGGAMTQDLGGLERELSSRLELEHTVLEARAQELRREARKQARQRAFLREERKRARDEKEAIVRDAAKLEHRDKDDWFPRDYLDATPQKRLRLNVGGQIFEINVSKLDNDPDSLLAFLLHSRPGRGGYTAREKQTKGSG